MIKQGYFASLHKAGQHVRSRDGLLRARSARSAAAADTELARALAFDAHPATGRRLRGCQRLPEAACVALEAVVSSSP